MPIPWFNKNRSTTSRQQNLKIETQVPAPMMNLVAEFELQQHGGPHREMAVDVPESFVARTKTPPRYPPPRNIMTNGTSTSSAKPVPPPRDHLRIEKDGRLINRAPPPQLPARALGGSQTIDTTDLSTTNKVSSRDNIESIRRVQDSARKRKEEEEKAAKEKEFLRSSLRDSRKLQALAQKPVAGIVNDGYANTEDLETESTATESLHNILSFNEIVGALQRLSTILNKCGRGLDVQLAAVQTLLLSPEFNNALSIHNKVCSVRASKLPGPTNTDAQKLVKDCLEALQPCSASGVDELAEILTRYELEGLLSAHDGLVKRLPDSPFSKSTSATVPINDQIPHKKPPSDTDSQYGDHIRIVKIEKTNEPLGATVRNEDDAVVIGRIVKGGAAEKCGLLREGDEIIEVNGVEMRGKTVNEVCEILSAMSGTLTFRILPNNSPRQNQTSTREILHLKAHFDYDPEDDAYIPCRELGISFQKGDILHVICQDDANWWQAYREGEEDQSLAGLVPSRVFTHQRESMKHSIIDDKSTKERPRKSGTLLCAKKNTKKKKKKTPYNATYNDDYDTDEVLTYEEVALYYPRANHKRPIVLIGPPNIGRHELRQRLMEDSDRFAAAIPHTSRTKDDNEVDGQDYHFISRTQFESDIVDRRFVEHGEFEKAYYGTSIDAIRSVINSGKICVLNLHPQSLKILRTSDLKPYVVFVAPPSLEKLRQKKLRSGESFKEEDLKDIIEKAREMEDKYGHYFDMVIINNDTERAYQQLLSEINSLEREPQWVPATWVKAM